MTTTKATASSTGRKLQALAAEQGWTSAPPSGDRLMFIKGDRTLFVFFDRRGAVRGAYEYRGDVMELDNIVWRLQATYGKKWPVMSCLEN